MLHAKFQNHRPSDSEEEDFLKFWLFIAMVAILFMCRPVNSPGYPVILTVLPLSNYLSIYLSILQHPLARIICRLSISLFFFPFIYLFIYYFFERERVREEKPVLAL